jgi:hypothetical protein
MLRDYQHALLKLQQLEQLSRRRFVPPIAFALLTAALQDRHDDFRSDHQIWLMTLYDKDEASDLTVKEKNALKVAMQRELTARAIRRVRPGKGRRIW